MPEQVVIWQVIWFVIRHEILHRMNTCRQENSQKITISLFFTQSNCVNQEKMQEFCGLYMILHLFDATVQKRALWCSIKESKSYGFGMTWGRVKDDRIIFGCTLPLTPKAVEQLRTQKSADFINKMCFFFFFLFRKVTLPHIRKKTVLEGLPLFLREKSACLLKMCLVNYHFHTLFPKPFV